MPEKQQEGKSTMTKSNNLLVLSYYGLVLFNLYTHVKMFGSYIRGFNLNPGLFPPH